MSDSKGDTALTIEMRGIKTSLETGMIIKNAPKSKKAII